MEKQLIIRGVGAGALGGVVAFVFTRIFAEPLISQAIAYESAREAAQAALSGTPYVPEPDVFSRSVQANIGVGVGMVLFGVAMGAMFAVAYAVCLRRANAVNGLDGASGLSARGLAVLLAGAGFVTLYLVPFLKYPANPPSIGHGDTIRQRTALYLAMVVCSVVFLAMAVLLAGRLQQRLGSWNAALVAGAVFVVAIGGLMAALPAYGHLAVNRQVYGSFATETPQPLVDGSGRIVFPGFSADLLYQFRLYSVLAQLLMWGTIGLVAGGLIDRVVRAARPVSAAETGSELVSA